MQRTKRIILSYMTAARMWAASGAVGLTLAWSACAVSSPIALTSTGEGLPTRAPVTLAPVTLASVTLAPADSPTNSLNARFASAVEQAMADSAIAIAADARFIADLSVGQMPASAGIVQGEGAGNGGNEETDWLVRPREKRRFDKCDAQVLRATLVIYDRTTGSVAYRGSGQATECDFADADLAQMARALVADALDPAGR